MHFGRAVKEGRFGMVCTGRKWVTVWILGEVWISLGARGEQGRVA